MFVDVGVSEFACVCSIFCSEFPSEGTLQTGQEQELALYSLMCMPNEAIQSTGIDERVVGYEDVGQVSQSR